MSVTDHSDAPAPVDKERAPSTVPFRGMKLAFLKIWPLLAVAFVLSFWLFLLRYMNLQTGENCFDCYYHVMMADLGPSVWTAKTFPWTTMSIWEENFCDKELLFHAMVFALRGWQYYLPLSLEPPFHFPVFWVCFLLLLVFAFTARAFRVAWIPLYVLMLVTISPSFTERILMLRPHNLGIILTLACCLTLAGVRETKHLWRPFVFALLFAWAYSPPLFVLMPAFAFAVAGLKANWRVHLLIPVAAVLGLLLGYVLHPQFPNTFIIWKIACVDIVRQILGGSKPVAIGAELKAPGMTWIWSNAAVPLLTGVNLILLAFLLKLKRWKLPERNTQALLLLNILTCAGIFFSNRIIEYACPFCVLCTGVLVSDLRKHIRIKRTAWRHLAAAAAVVLLVAAVLVTDKFSKPRLHQTPVMRGFASWAEKRLPPGTVVANLAWSDFPMLFYSAPQYRYLIALDPMYAYYRYPDRVARLEAFRQGFVKMSASDLAELVGARYAFISRFGWRLAEDMYNDGFSPVYQGSDGWLFDLTKSELRQKQLREERESTRTPRHPNPLSYFCVNP